MKHQHSIYFVIIMLALCICLSGCIPRTQPASLDRLLCYPGIQWNMTPEEVKTALQLQEDAFIPQPEENSKQIFSVEGIEVFGETANVVFSFVKAAGDNYGLDYVYVLFPDDTDMTSLQDTLSAQLGRPLLPPNRAEDGHTVYWDSSETLQDYTQYVQIANDSPAARVFWTDSAQLYFECYGQKEPAWRETYPNRNMIVFEGFLTPLLQSG